MQRFNITDFENIFFKLVRNINTRNFDWKKDCIGRIDWALNDYLSNEVFHNNIIQFNLKIQRIGQSKIECNCEYIEKYYDLPKTINIQESVKTPNQICRSVLFAVENAITQKVRVGGF
jgi:hypothetical protein